MMAISASQLLAPATVRVWGVPSAVRRTTQDEPCLNGLWFTLAQSPPGNGFSNCTSNAARYYKMIRSGKFCWSQGADRKRS